MFQRRLAPDRFSGSDAARFSCDFEICNLDRRNIPTSADNRYARIFSADGLHADCNSTGGYVTVFRDEDLELFKVVQRTE